MSTAWSQQLMIIGLELVVKPQTRAAAVFSK